MKQVWTRQRAGTTSHADPKPLVRQPVPERPQIHLIELPLDWGPGSTQVYLIEGQPLTLIDTGVASEASALALGAALESLGYAFAEIERVIVTHAHRDHFGFVEGLRREGADLECCVHADDAETVERFAATVEARIDGLLPLFVEHGMPPDQARALVEERRARLPKDVQEGEPARVDRILRDGDRIAWKDWHLVVQHAPGHTPGHILLEDPQEGLLFSGDQVMGQAMPKAETFYRPGPGDPTDPLARRSRFRGLVAMRSSLRALRGRPFRMLLPGYGGVLPRAERAIRDTLLYYDVRLQRIDRGLRSLAAIGQDVTAFDLGEALFRTDAGPPEQRDHLLQVIGALDCLEADGLLVTERRGDGVLIHHHR